MAMPNVANHSPEPLKNHIETRRFLADKRADMRAATHELRTTLRLMSDLVGRCIEADADDAALAPLELEYEQASGHLLSLASSIRDIAATLKVSL